jgi:MFS family permease
MVGSSLVGILPAWGLLLGLSAGAASLLAASVLIGSLILQWPIGYLSDHVDRRRVIAGAASAALGLSLIILLIPVDAASLLYLMFALLGGVTLPIYAISISHAFDQAGGQRAVGLSSSLLFCWALGSIIGPIAATRAMEHFGSAGLPYFIAGLGGLSLLVLVPHLRLSSQHK